MKDPQTGVSVSIFGKDFRVSCPDDEREDLVKAARYLDQKMQEIHSSGKVLGAERCAVMAALNIAHELLKMQQGTGFPPEFEERIRALSMKIGSVLESSAQNHL
ncbi:MAG: cell division protein ZapA [Acidiferrobacterales bacterium]